MVMMDGNDDVTYKDIRADNSATIAGIKVEHVETAGGTEQGELVACAGGIVGGEVGMVKTVMIW